MISIRRSLPSLPADHMISLSHSACHNSRKLIMQCRLTSQQCCNRYGRWLISCGGLRTVSLRIRPNVYYFRLLFWRNVPQVLSGVFFFVFFFSLVDNFQKDILREFRFLNQRMPSVLPTPRVLFNYCLCKLEFNILFTLCLNCQMSPDRSENKRIATCAIFRPRGGS